MCKQIFKYYQCGHGASAPVLRCEYASTIDSPFWIPHECLDYESVTAPPVPRYCGGPGFYCGHSQIGQVLEPHHETYLNANVIIADIGDQYDELISKGRCVAYLEQKNTDTGLIWNTYEMQTYKMLREKYFIAMAAKRDADAILQDGCDFLKSRGWHQGPVVYRIPACFIDGVAKLREASPIWAQPLTLDAFEKYALRYHLYKSQLPPGTLIGGPGSRPGLAPQASVQTMQVPRTSVPPPKTILQLRGTAMQLPRNADQPSSSPAQLTNTSSPIVQVFGMRPPALPAGISARRLGQKYPPGFATSPTSAPSQRPTSKKQRPSLFQPEPVRRSKRVQNKIDYAGSERSATSHGSPSPEKSDRISPTKSDISSDDVFGPSAREARNPEWLKDMVQDYKRRQTLRPFTHQQQSPSQVPRQETPPASTPARQYPGDFDGSKK